MPRRARLSVAGVPWQIMQRGNNRSACFYCEEDYLFYLEQLLQQSKKFECAIHAYCLMTNHVPILLTPAATGSASPMMKNLGQRFVLLINCTYRRSGTLWEGRFKSCLVQSENYAFGDDRFEAEIDEGITTQGHAGQAAPEKTINRGLSLILLHPRLYP